MMNKFLQFFQNPMQAILGSRLNIPQNFQGNETDLVQYLLNSGQITQEQYNDLNRRAREIQENPQFKKMFGIK